LELYASRITLIENINQRITKEEGFNDQKLFDFNSLLEGYLSGNMLEVEEVSKVAKYLALGISNCINFVNPSMVVIGDEFSHFGESFLQTIKTEVKMRLLSKTYETVEIMLSSKKNDSVLEGAFINSMTKTYLNP
jgi:predicted NBD/HSP70 family sugar kinase